MNDPVLRLKLQQQVFKTGMFREQFVKPIVKIRILLFSTYKNKVMRCKRLDLKHILTQCHELLLVFRKYCSRMNKLVTNYPQSWLYCGFQIVCMFVRLANQTTKRVEKCIFCQHTYTRIYLEHFWEFIENLPLFRPKPLKIIFKKSHSDYIIRFVTEIRLGILYDLVNIHSPLCVLYYTIHVKVVWKLLALASKPQTLF